MNFKWLRPTKGKHLKTQKYLTEGNAGEIQLSERSSQM